jgi:hypothetical protein
MFNWIKKLFSKSPPAVPTNKVPSFVITCTIEDQLGYKVEADWDPEFIKSLQQRGYGGASEDTIVSHWMRDMYLAQSNKLSTDGQEFI